MKLISLLFGKYKTLQEHTGWRPVVAAYQWWPFVFCTGNYVFIASQNRQLCKRKQKNQYKKDWLNSLSVRQKVDSFPKPPTCQHRGIS